MFKALTKFFKFSKSSKFLKFSKFKPCQMIILEYSYSQNDINSCNSKKLLNMSGLFWCELIHFYKHVQTCHNAMIWFYKHDQTCLDTILQSFSINMLTCLDLFLIIRLWNTLKYEQTAEKEFPTTTKWFLGSLRANRTIKNGIY